jgi:RNA polymerase sigma-70 factor (ECF subfamily)
MATSDDQLIERAVAGDQQALTELLERYGPIVRQKLRGQIDPRWQSVLSEDDVMQESYADAFLNINRFENRGEGSFQRWLTVVTRNNLRDAIKGLSAAKSGGGQTRLASQGEDDAHLRLLDTLSGSSTSPSERAARNETRQLLEVLLSRLPPAYQQTVRLYDLQERSVAEVAAQLNCSPGAVYMRRARAHAKLRELLASESHY